MRCSLTLVLILLLAGCGRGRRGEFVEGTVTLDGRPLPACNLLLVPTGRDGTQVSGRADNTGRFQLKDVPLAEYVVLVNLLPEGHAGDVKLEAEVARSTSGRGLPAAYGLVTRTPLRITVPTQGSVQMKLVTNLPPDPASVP